MAEFRRIVVEKGNGHLVELWVPFELAGNEVPRAPGPDDEDPTFAAFHVGICGDPVRYEPQCKPEPADKEQGEHPIDGEHAPGKTNVYTLHLLDRGHDADADRDDDRRDRDNHRL